MRQERVYGLQLRDACARPNSQRRQPAARTHISSYIPCIYTPRVYRYTLCNSYMSRTIYPYQINPYTRICAKHAKSAHIKSLGLCGCTDFGPWICQSTSLWEKAPILVVYAILCDDTPCVSHQRKYMYMYIYIYILNIYIFQFMYKYVYTHIHKTVRGQSLFRCGVATVCDCWIAWAFCKRTHSNYVSIANEMWRFRSIHMNATVWISNI